MNKKNYRLSSFKTASSNYRGLTEVEQLEIILQLLKQVAWSPSIAKASRLFYTDLIVELAFRIYDLREDD